MTLHSQLLAELPFVANKDAHLLAGRFPTMKHAVDADELRLRDDIVAGGLLSVPVTW